MKKWLKISLIILWILIILWWVIACLVKTWIISRWSKDSVINEDVVIHYVDEYDGDCCSCCPNLKPWEMCSAMCCPCK